MYVGWLCLMMFYGMIKGDWYCYNWNVFISEVIVGDNGWIYELFFIYWLWFLKDFMIFFEFVVLEVLIRLLSLVRDVRVFNWDLIIDVVGLWFISLFIVWFRLLYNVYLIEVILGDWFKFWNILYIMIEWLLLVIGVGRF